MDLQVLLQELTNAVLIPALIILVRYAGIIIKAKMQQWENTREDALEKKYIEMLSDTITNCVISTNQTYVESLKNKNAFDAEAQKTAFSITYKAVTEQLTEEMKKYLENIYGDLNSYIIKKIEAEVNANKILMTQA